MSSSGATSPTGRARRAPGRLLERYARLLGPLLGGYLLLDRAFAYLHVPGTPLFVGEAALLLGTAGVLTATGHLRAAVRGRPLVVLLAAFALWGLACTLPGLPVYGTDAARDAALWYYCCFAFLAVAAVHAAPDLPERLLAQLSRFVPALLLWLPVGLLLSPVADRAPDVPFSTVSVLSHKPGNAAIAALLALACLWLFPGRRSPRSQAFWSVLVLVVVALAATQNRGGLLGVAAGATVGLLLVPHPWRLVGRAVAVVALGLGLAVLLAPTAGPTGVQGRAFSPSQLVANVVSLGGADSPGNLGGTVEGREDLWTRILHEQVAGGRLVDGSGFGPNLAARVGIYDEGKETLRSPHNSHLHVLARMGLIGLGLWIAVWAGWYRRLLRACRRPAGQGEDGRRRVAVLCLAVATAVLVSSVFDPQLEGAQIAALLWTVFGVGVAVTGTRGTAP